ncbi:hypothetical protein EV356DRAFT_495979 [Viridothelium virens]|uniref:Uncharacterized protein n=1 Tax=Viridothelium virens TaxID=1048519 RepID=A0A6A6HRE0_VIRVR|nr:hypothetical protein EV356DRAFT_495979 [Viridothelium virens]
MASVMISPDRVLDGIRHVYEEIHRHNPRTCVAVTCLYECGHFYIRTARHSCMPIGQSVPAVPPCIELVRTTVQLRLSCRDCFRANMASSLSPEQSLENNPGQPRQDEASLDSEAEPSSLSLVTRTSSGPTNNFASSQDDQTRSPNETRLFDPGFRPHGFNSVGTSPRGNANDQIAFASHRPPPPGLTERQYLSLLTQLNAVMKYLPKVRSPLHIVTNASQ